ncbi:MAG: restriction endonuclease [Clostridiales bacterium]|nr:restriction endonuclease [Clostridiales bacterium]
MLPKDNSEIDFNPYRDIATVIDAKDFELYCCEGISAIAEKEHLQDVVIRHDYNPTPFDGKRQIDIWCEYTALGSKQIILGECKLTKRKIEIGVVEKLKARIDSLGAQRGYIFATAGFQKGAVDYACAHRIVLVHVLDKQVKFITNSINNSDEQMRLYITECYMRTPQYFLVQLNNNNNMVFEQLYPTAEMEKKMRREIVEDLKLGGNK